MRRGRRVYYIGMVKEPSEVSAFLKLREVYPNAEIEVRPIKKRSSIGILCQQHKSFQLFAGEDDLVIEDSRNGAIFYNAQLWVLWHKRTKGYQFAVKDGFKTVWRMKYVRRTDAYILRELEERRFGREKLMVEHEIMQILRRYQIRLNFCGCRPISLEDNVGEVRLEQREDGTYLEHLQEEAELGLQEEWDEEDWEEWREWTGEDEDEEW